MEIKNFLEILQKKLWLILLVTFIATVGSAYVNLSKKSSVYESKSTLYIMTRKYNINNPNLNNDDIMVSKQMIKDYKELLTSRKVIDATIQELGIPGMTEDALTKAVSINPRNDTNVLEITAIASNPVEARDISNTLTTVFINKVKELTNEDNIGVVDLAEIPQMPMESNGKKNIALSFMAGILGSIAIIYIFEQLDTTIRKPEAVEKEFGFKVLGMIPSKDIK